MNRRQQICKDFVDDIVQEVIEPLSNLGSGSDKNVDSNFIVLKMKEDPSKFVNTLLDSVTNNILDYYYNRSQNVPLSTVPSPKRKIKKKPHILSNEEDELIKIEILGKAVLNIFSLHNEYNRIKDSIVNQHMQSKSPKKQKIQLPPILKDDETVDMIKLFNSFHSTVLKYLLKTIHKIITEVYGIKLCEDLTKLVNSKSYPYFLFEYFLRHQSSSDDIKRQLECLKHSSILVYNWIIQNCIDIKIKPENES